MPKNSLPKIEFRSVQKLEIREAGEKEGIIGTLVGYAALFDTDSVNFGGWIERIKPGAFSRSLRENKDVRALYQHDTGAILARGKNNTLRIEEDSKGLRVEIDLIDTALHRDVLANVRSGLIDAMSFGFWPVKQSWQFNDEAGAVDVRTLEDVDLHEVSAVTFPAYEDTELSARSRDEFRASGEAGTSRTTPLGLLLKRQALEKLTHN